METFEQQTFASFEDESMCSAQASPASQQVWPGSEKAQKMTVGSGRQLSMLLNVSSPLGAFSKILLESSLWTNSEEYCYVWNRLDTKFALSALVLTPLGQSTGDNGCSLWPTPHAGNFNDGESLETWESRRQVNKAKGINGNGQGTPLAIAAKLWPTPRNDHSGLESHGVTALGGSLNPEFVENLMGFPIGWTNLE